MGKKRTRNRQTSMWVATVDLPRSAGHPFYDRLNRVLDDAGFDAFVEAQCAPFYTFADILNRRQPNVVKDKLNEWLSWASRSRLPGFVKVARTIRTHLDEIVAYIRWGVTNGIVEGLHNKVRVIIRRAFGFHSASARRVGRCLDRPLNRPSPGPFQPGFPISLWYRTARTAQRALISGAPT